MTAGLSGPIDPTSTSVTGDTTDPLVEVDGSILTRAENLYRSSAGQELTRNFTQVRPRDEQPEPQLPFPKWKKTAKAAPPICGTMRARFGGIAG